MHTLSNRTSGDMDLGEDVYIETWVYHPECLPWPQRGRLREKRMGVNNHALQCLDNQHCVCVCVWVCVWISIEGAAGFSSQQLNGFHSFSVWIETLSHMPISATTRRNRSKQSDNMFYSQSGLFSFTHKSMQELWFAWFLKMHPTPFLFSQLMLFLLWIYKPSSTYSQLKWHRCGLWCGRLIGRW